ncbi:Chromosomal replication initiator protein DnaA [Planctomycetes bacterium MalM25]|nr:Chromosomal replication initiator protein DnaA [Planctomycetes bacterium MalM25]
MNVPAVRLDNRRVTPLPLPGALGLGRAQAGANQSQAGANGGRGSRKTAGRALPAEPIYYAGPENTLVATAVGRLIAAARDKGAGQFAGPMTLIGPPGSGKSLLATGAAAAWADTHGPERVMAITGVDLRRQYERAISAERNEPGLAAAIADRLAGLRMLVIEDLEGLAPSVLSVALLKGLLDQYEESGARLLVTAGKPLGETAGLDTQTVSRLAAGITLEVAAPADEARRELLVASLEATGSRIDPPAADDLAAWLPADARLVLSVAEQLKQRFGTRALIDRRCVKAFVADATHDEASLPLSDIAGVVARYYSMPLRQLRSSSRKAPIVLARAVTIYLARQLTPLSYDEIGRYLGGRDHTTVMHNYNRINKRMPSDRALRSAIGDLLRKLGRAGTVPPQADDAEGWG